MLLTIAPVIFMITGCEDERRQVVANQGKNAPGTEATPANGTSPKEPCCVKVSTIFVEITQEDTEELGFEWIPESIGTGNALPETSDKTLPTDH